MIKCVCLSFAMSISYQYNQGLIGLSIFILQKADINNCKFVFKIIFNYKTKNKTQKVIDVNLTQANCKDGK